MALAGALEIQMSMGIARITSDVAQVKGIVGSGMKSIEASVASAKSVLASLGVGLSAGYFVSIIKGAIDAADHLRDLSKSTSIAVEQLAGLRLAARQSGGDLEGIAASINKLSMNMGKDAEKFKALGVTAKDPLKAFQQLADVFVAIKDPQLRAAVAAQALGKSWAGAAPLLAEGGAKIGEMVEKGTKLSGVTKKLTDDADEFNDKLAELAGNGRLINTAIAPMLPLLNTLADDMLKAREQSTGLDSSFSPLAETLRALIVLGGNVSFVFKGVGTEIGGIAAQITAFASGDFKGAMAIGDMLKKDAARAREEHDAWEKRMMEVGTRAAPAVAAAATNSAADEAKKKAAEEAAKRFLKGEKEAKLAAAELLKYENALKSLEDQLGNLNNATLEEKMINDLAKGSLKGLTLEHQANLITVAKQIDAKKTQEAVSKSLIAAIEAQIAAQEKLDEGATAFFTTNRKLVQDLEFEASIMGKNALEKEKLVALRKIENDYNVQAGIIAATESLTMDEQAKRLGDLTQARERATAAVSVGIGTRTSANTLDQKAIEQIQFETKLISMNTTEREQAIAVRALELTGIDKNTEAYKAYVAQLKGAIAEKNFAEENKAVLVGMWQDIERVAHDTFVSIFDSGKNAFDRLRDTLKNGLYSLLYQLTLKPILINIVASSAGAGVAQSVFGTAGGGASSAIGSLSNLSSVGNLFGGAGLLGSAAAYGAAVPGLSIGGAQAAMLASQTGVFGGAGLAATAEAAGATAGATAISAISTAIPVVAAALAVYALYQTFKSKKSPAVGTGYTYSGSSAFGSGFSGNITANAANNETTFADRLHEEAHVAWVSNYNIELAKTFVNLQRMATVLGLDASALNTKVFSINATASLQEGLGVAMQQAIAQTVNQAITTLIPNVAELALEGEALDATLTRLAAEFDVTTRIAQLLGKDSASAFGLVGTASLTMRDRLVQLLGGLQNAATALDSYYAAFFSDSERHARDLEILTDTLHGLGVDTLPATKAAFRELVEAQDLSTDAGQRMFAQLLQISAAFAQVADYSASAAAGLDTLAGRIAGLSTTLSDSLTDQIRASQAAAETAHRSADSYRQLAASLADAASRLRGGGRGAAGGTLDALFGTAMSGNAAALAALPQAAEDFLSASKATARTSIEFARDQAKAVAMLTQASGVSGGMATWQDYQATLLETQTGALQAIQAQLELPDPSLGILTEQTGVLSTIAELLRGQTAQIVSGNGMQAVLMHDQTGAIISSNAIGNAQLQAALGTASALDSIRALSDSQLQALLGTAGSLSDIRSLSDAQLGALVGSATSLDFIRALGDAQLQAIFGTSVTLASIRAMGDAQFGAMLSSAAALDAIRGMSNEQLAALVGTSATLAGIRALSDAQLAAVLGTDSTLSTIRALSTAQLTELLGAGATQDVIRSLTGTQTQQIITGNAVQDVIRNITALDTSYSAEMLRALIEANSTQIGTFQAMLAGSDQTVSLLQQLVALMGQSQAEAAALVWGQSQQGEIRKAEQAAASTAAAAAAQQAVQSAQQAAPPTSTPPNYWIDETGSARSFYFTDEEGHSRYYNPADPDNAYAGGGIASGWSIVGERGPELANFTSPARVYTASQTRSMMGGDTAALEARIDDLIEKLDQLRMENNSANMTVARNTKRIADTQDQVTTGGAAMITTPA